ncbi:MAG: DNA-processing protein DprA [Nocardioides sp.]|nr:DNA-processing protein DprA [Nocardioides sp.]
MNDSHEDRLARVALGRLGEPGDPRVSNLVSELGATRLYDHLAQQRDEGGLLDEVAARLATLDPEADLDRAARQGIRFVIPGDDEWPSQLDELDYCEALQDRAGAPLGLWARGPVRLNEVGNSIAVVGSRSATSYGADVAGELSARVVEKKVSVISGAAFGIDQAAHRGALAAGGGTIAVLACGVDRAYPAAHADLLRYIGEHGVVVSELAPGCAPTRLRFLARNRIIAGLARGSVVVEAAVRSGALNTANWTGRLNRFLMGVPGPVTSAPSAGVHQLIRTGAATLVTQAGEVLEVIGASGEALFEMPKAPEKARDRLSTRDAQVLDAVPVSKPAQADSIARTAGVGLVGARRSLDNLSGMGLVEVSQHGWRLSAVGRA